jgi:glutathione S-transferase
VKLYGSLTSPYTRKARVLIIEKRIDCEFVMRDPWAADSPIPLMNPLGKVPVLEIGPDSFLFESTLVVSYLDHLDGKPLLPRDAPGYWRSQWWQALAQGLIDATVARLHETRRPDDKRMPQVTEREEMRIMRALGTAERAHAGTAHLAGRAFGTADVALGVALQYIDFRHPHDWRSGHPRLAKWLDGIARRESFERTLPPGYTKS